MTYNIINHPSQISKTLMEQFYKMTLESAIESHKKGFITSTGLVHYFFQIELKYGWKRKYSPKYIYTLLGISKASFYKAIASLKNDGFINFEVHGEIVITNCTPESPSSKDFSETVSDRRQESQIVDKSLRTETRVSELRQESQIVDFETSKPAIHKASGNSPDYISDSYQIFLKSLSQEEKEKFLEFGIQESKKLPNPPSLPLKWIESCYADLKAQWESLKFNTHDEISSHQSNKFGNWANHPRFNEMWLNVCKLGTTSYVIQNIKDQTIKEFCKYCSDRPEIIKEILECLSSTSH